MIKVNWQLKSLVQRFCAGLPLGSDFVYYQLQRRLGSFRNPLPPDLLLADAASFNEWLHSAKLGFRGRRCMEVGTGRRVDMPFAFYVLGAAETHTFDLTRYLRPELVEFSLACMVRDREHYEQIFTTVAEDPEECRYRLNKLLAATNAAEAMKIANIKYHAPADATKTGLPAGSIDVQTSYTVFEHIPEAVLRSILVEARRLLAPSGVVLHHVDPSDHFAHDDVSISSIHFLRFSPSEWERYGANKYAYHNRLRVHEHREIFEQCGYEIIREQVVINERALAEVRSGAFPLAEEYRQLTPEQISGVVIRMLARPLA